MLASFLKYLNIEKGYSAHTVRSYGDDVRQFFSFCGFDAENPQHFTITHRHVRSWLSYLLSNGYAPRSANRKLSSLRTFFSYLQREGKIASNPLARVIAPKSGKRLPSFVGEGEMEKLLDTALFPATFTGQRDMLIVMLFYMTGMRLSELVDLRIDDFDPGNDTVRVMGKGRKERIIPVHPGLKAIIGSYFSYRDRVDANRNERRLFITDKGKPVYPKLVYRTVKHYLSLITTLEKKSPHVLRHTFATHLLNNGAQLNAIKELLGHANLSATQVYTHNSFEKLKKTYQQAHPRA